MQTEAAGVVQTGHVLVVIPVIPPEDDMAEVATSRRANGAKRWRIKTLKIQRISSC